MQRITERGIEFYGVSLHPVVNENVVQDNAFQWSIILERIDGFDIRNRDWQVVGPVFATRDKGSKWLGFEKRFDQATIKAHEDSLIEEYNALYSDEPQGSQLQAAGARHKSFSRMGRPSQGRSYRLQATLTPEQASWLETQRQPSDKSMSDIVYRLIEEARQQGS